jgi:phage major head subunit gpT-like protein
MIINQANLQAIYQSFSAVFRQAFDGAPSMWQRIAMTVPSGGASMSYDWLGDFPMLREWLGDRVIKDLAAFHYELTNKNYEATIEVDRNHIDDDQIGLYAPRFQQLGYDAKKHADLLIFALLKAGTSTDCFDGKKFFAANHKVKGSSVANINTGGAATVWYLLDVSRPIKPLLLQQRQDIQFVAMDQPTDENVFMRRKYRYGVDDRKNVGFGLWQLAYCSNQALGDTYYAAARAAMMSFKNEEDVPLGIIPNLLVVPPTLEGTANALLKVPTLSDGAGNPWYNTADVLVAPWLA